MITTSLSLSQSIMNDETLLCEDLTTLNQNSSSSILYRTLNIQYISQEYIIQSKGEKRKSSNEISILNYLEDNSLESIQKLSSENLTPRNISIIELITSEQRFVNDLKNILKVILLIFCSFKFNRISLRHI